MNLLFIQNDGAEAVVVEAAEAPVVENAVEVAETVTEEVVDEGVLPEQPEPTFMQQYGMWFLV